MKVCMISTAPPRPCGIANYSVKLAKALCNEGRCSLVVLSDDYDANAENAFVSSGRLRVTKAWTRNSFLYPFQIFRTLVREKPDVIHIQHEYLLFGRPQVSGVFPAFLLLLQLLRKPIIITMHSVIPRTSLSTGFFTRYGLEGRFASLEKSATFIVTMLLGVFASRVVVHLKSAKKTLIEYYKFAPEKIAVIPHGIDNFEADLKQSDAKKKLNLRGKRIVLFFGFIRQSKGIEHLLEAMPTIASQYPDVALMIVGGYHPYLTDGNTDYLGQLKALVHGMKLDDKVVFVNGFVPQEELPIYFIASDVAVFPYVEADVLGTSGALWSIAGYGKPVIVSSVGRFSEDINDGENGLLVPPADPTGLAKAVISVFSNPDLRQRISENLGNKVRENAWEKIAEKTVNLYTNLYCKMAVNEPDEKNAT